MKALRGSYTHYAISYRELVHVAGGLLEAIWKLHGVLASKTQRGKIGYSDSKK